MGTPGETTMNTTATKVEFRPELLRVWRAADDDEGLPISGVVSIDWNPDRVRTCATNGRVLLVATCSSAAEVSGSVLVPSLAVRRLAELSTPKNRRDVVSGSASVGRTDNGPWSLSVSSVKTATLYTAEFSPKSIDFPNVDEVIPDYGDSTGTPHVGLTIEYLELARRTIADVLPDAEAVHLYVPCIDRTAVSLAASHGDVSVMAVIMPRILEDPQRIKGTGSNGSTAHESARKAKADAAEAEKRSRLLARFAELVAGDRAGSLAMRSLQSAVRLLEDAPPRSGAEVSR